MTADRPASPDTITYRRGRIEGDRLTRALIDAASRGQRPNCSDVEKDSYWDGRGLARKMVSSAELNNGA